jgi:hypothetical protein
VTTTQFEFESSEAGSSFECSMDSVAFTVCTTPADYADLAAGEHTFRVRARNVAGDFDRSPAERSFSVQISESTPEPEPKPTPTPEPEPTPEPGYECGWATGWGKFTALRSPGACWRPYSDSSPWNTPVGSNPQLASNSAAIVDKVTSYATAAPRNNNQNLADTYKDWDHPIYFSQPDDPLFELRFRQDGQRVTWGTSPSLEGMKIRIPDEARPAGGEDAHLSVIDQQTGYEYGFWGVQRKPKGGGTLVATSGGRTPIDGSGTNVDASAAYFPPAAGMIRPAELEAGEINHALFMGVACTNGTNVSPANPDHGSGATCQNRLGISNTNAPAIGQRFFLDMGEAQINALPAPEWKRTILRAMAEYGMYVGDTGGAGWGIKFESGSSYTSFGRQDEWIRVGDKLGAVKWNDPETGRTLRVFKLANVIDWESRLKVLQP